MSDFEQVDFDNVKVTLSHDEILYLENDLIAYILQIKSKVIGQRAFNYSAENDDNLTEEEKKNLESLGYYDRIDLLKKIKNVEMACFPEYNTYE